jgi:N-acetylmuramoyl-L-alanine amidase
MIPTIALCVGHSRQINGRLDGGAVSVGGVSEWTYNRRLADLIGAHLTRNRLRWFIVDAYPGKGYGAAIAWLARHLAERAADVAIELHFNSAGPTATGHEWLYWHTSKSGRRLAESIDLEFRLQLPPNVLRPRGCKPIPPNGRGSEFLRRTHCPAIITEPFFGSHAGDWKIATESQDRIAIAIANGIAEWVGP